MVQRYEATHGSSLSVFPLRDLFSTQVHRQVDADDGSYAVFVGTDGYWVYNSTAWLKQVSVPDIEPTFDAPSPPIPEVALATSTNVATAVSTSTAAYTSASCRTWNIQLVYVIALKFIVVLCDSARTVLGTTAAATSTEVGGTSLITSISSASTVSYSSITNSVTLGSSTTGTSYAYYLLLMNLHTGSSTFQCAGPRPAPEAVCHDGNPPYWFIDGSVTAINFTVAGPVTIGGNATFTPGGQLVIQVSGVECLFFCVLFNCGHFSLLTSCLRVRVRQCLM